MKKFLFAVCMLSLTTVVFAVNEPSINRNEEDSIECLKNYSIYVLNLKKKMYDYTVSSWKYMFENCPDMKIRLYSDGIKLYEHYYDIAKTEKRRNEMVDTIMMIWDQRMLYFGNHPKYSKGWILGRKSLDLVKYRRGVDDAKKEAYKMFKQSFELIGDKSEDVVLFNWLITSSSLYTSGDIGAQQFLNDFLTISTVLDVQIEKANEESLKRKLLVRESCEELLVKSGAGDCMSMEPFLADQYIADKENVENIKRIVSLLDKLGCVDSKLYFEVAEKSYSLNSSSESAYHLAKMFVKKENYEKAKEYYQESISLEQDNEKLSKYYYELAVLEFGHFNNYPESRSLARKAISQKGDWGKPYLLIGSVYAAESKRYGTNEFENSTVYWIAIDNFIKAKNVDSSCAEEASKQIALYTPYIPDKETGFFHGLSEGDTYNIGSWINEETKVRFR